MKKDNLSINTDDHKIPKYKEAASVISVNQEKGLDLYCTVKVDGEEVTRFKSDSFVVGFPYLLGGRMRGGRYRINGFTSAPGFSLTDSTVSTVTNVISASPLRLRVYASNFNIDALSAITPYNEVNPTKVIINGASDIDFNGVYLVERASNYDFFVYNLDGTPVDATSYGSITGAHFCFMDAIYASQRSAYTGSNSGGFYNKYSLSFWDIIVGADDAPVDIEDVYLYKRYAHGSGAGKISHGVTNYSPLATDKPTSRFTISKTFTNNSGTNLLVKELGIISGYGNYNSNLANALPNMLVRDVLGSPIIVPSGKTLTIDYEIVTRLSPDTQDTDTDGSNGGFLSGFAAALRVLASLKAPSDGYQNYFFCCKGPGYSNPVNNDASFELRTLGVLVGDDNTYVSMTDTKLNPLDPDRNGYKHGDGDGELFYHGTYVEEVVIDKPNNKAILEVYSIIENKSSIAAVVKEKGLFGIYNTGNTSTRMYARMALHPDDQFTIQPGEIYKVKFIIDIVA